MIFPRSLQKSVVVTPCIVKPDSALTNARYPVSGSFIDISKYDRCAFLVHLGTIADTISFSVYADVTAAETGDIAAVTSATYTLNAATDDGNYFLIEFSPAKVAALNTASLSYRYVTLVVAGNSGSNYAEILFLGTHARSEPVTQSAYSIAHSIDLGG